MLNLMELLEPIPGDFRTGINLREKPSEEYIALKDARMSARQQERNAIIEEDNQTSRDLRHWKKICELAPQILKEQAKDLNVVAWLVEALVRLEGFEGLVKGIELLFGLIEGYWEDIYPLPDEEGVMTTLAPLVGLNGDQSEGTLIVPIYSIPLTQSSNQENIAAWHYQQALSLSKITDPEKREKLVTGGAYTLEKVKAIVQGTPFAYFEHLEITLAECIDKLSNLDELLETRCEAGDVALTSHIFSALRFCGETIQGFKKIVASSMQSALKENITDKKNNEERLNPMKNNAEWTESKVAFKEEAFQTLLTIADQFKRYEPHSPIPYLLEQAVRWGNLPLPDLLAEIIPNLKSLNAAYRLIGINEHSLEEKENQVEED